MAFVLPSYLMYEVRQLQDVDPIISFLLPNSLKKQSIPSTGARHH